jgi:hypothetical protein
VTFLIQCEILDLRSLASEVSVFQGYYVVHRFTARWVPDVTRQYSGLIVKGRKDGNPSGRDAAPYTRRRAIFLIQSTVDPFIIIIMLKFLCN